MDETTSTNEADELRPATSEPLTAVTVSRTSPVELTHACGSFARNRFLATAVGSYDNASTSAEAEPKPARSSASNKCTCDRAKVVDANGGQLEARKWRL